MDELSYKPGLCPPLHGHVVIKTEAKNQDNLSKLEKLHFLY